MTADSFIAFVVMSTIVGLLIGLARYAYDTRKRLDDSDNQLKFLLRDWARMHTRLTALEGQLGVTVDEQ